MTDGIFARPIDLLGFVSLEHEQFLISLANNREEMAIINHLQGLYSAAMSDMEVGPNEFVIFQLLTFTHYHFLFSTASLMRCHLSEAFASVRTAIDAALIAAQIIHDRASQVAYVKREKPFDKLMRHYKNLIRDGKPLPHRLIQLLVELHDKLSMFASHADVNSFVHRIKTVEDESKRTMVVQYFQFAKDRDERAIHAYTLFHAFVMMLDVFSDFLVSEQKAVPAQWQTELRGLGGKIERRHTDLRERVKATPSSEGKS
jgi:hypothetical protein